MLRSRNSCSVSRDSPNERPARRPQRRRALPRHQKVKTILSDAPSLGRPHGPSVARHVQIGPALLYVGRVAADHKHSSPACAAPLLPVTGASTMRIPSSFASAAMRRENEGLTVLQSTTEHQPAAPSGSRRGEGGLEHSLWPGQHREEHAGLPAHVGRRLRPHGPIRD